MNQSEERAKRLLREMSDDPASLTRRKAYHRSTFLRLYMDHCDGLIFDNPQYALPWARVAPDIALLVPADKDHAEGLAMAHAVLGGALRSVGKHDQADAEYQIALRIGDSDAVSLDVRAEITSRFAMLRACQQRLDEALDLASTAVAHYRGHKHAKLAEALARLGYVLIVRGAYDESIYVTGEALELSEPRLSARSARVHHTATHNLAWAALNTSSVGVLRDGLIQVRTARKLLRSHCDGVPRHKLGWLEGLLWWALDMHPRAITALASARRGFLRLALPFEIVLVSIDLAAMHAYFRDYEQASIIAAGAFEYVEVLKSDREAIAVLKVWLDAIQAGELTEAISTTTRQMIETRIGPGGCCRSRKN